MASVRNEMALMNAQQLINVCSSGFFYLSDATEWTTQKTNEKCFQKCVTKPGSALSGSEEVRQLSLTTSVPKA